LCGGYGEGQIEEYWKINIRKYDLEMSELPGYYLSPEKNSALAVISLVSGIVGITLFPLIGSVVAIISGRSAKREIDESGGTLGGYNLAQAGLILGWIGLVFTILGFVIAFGVLGCSASVLVFFLGV
jgi:hypothetical protein